MAHFKDGTSRIPRYVIDARDCSFDLLGPLVIGHMFMPSSMCAQW